MNHNNLDYMFFFITLCLLFFPRTGYTAKQARDIVMSERKIEELYLQKGKTLAISLPIKSISAITGAPPSQLKVETFDRNIFLLLNASTPLDTPLHIILRGGKRYSFRLISTQGSTYDDVVRIWDEAEEQTFKKEKGNVR